jgi:hypothetical protein
LKVSRSRRTRLWIELELKNQLFNLTGLRSNDLFTVLGLRDSLQLDPAQIERLDELNERYLMQRDSIYSALAVFLTGWTASYRDAGPRQKWHQTVAAAARLTFETGTRARQILSHEQFAWLKKRGRALSLEYTTEWLDRLTRGPLLTPW